MDDMTEIIRATALHIIFTTSLLLWVE